jgi:hypothetical protein
MKKILPYADPVINYDPQTNAISAVINTNIKSYGYYLCENYIQMCRLLPWELRFENFEFSFDSYSCFDAISLSKDFLLTKNKIEDFLFELLNNGYYIATNVDVSSVSAYNRDSYNQHQITIYGVDTEKGYFSCADFFDGNYYSKAQCKVTEVVTGSYNAQPSVKQKYASVPYFDNNVGFKLKQLADDVDDDHPPYNPNKILNSLYSLLKDYSYANFISNVVYPVYGIRLFDTFVEWLAYNPYPNVAPVFTDYYHLKMNFHFLIEHTKLMKNRILYFDRKGLLIDDPMVKACDELYGAFSSCRNIVTKAAVSKNELTSENIEYFIANLTAGKQKYIDVISFLIAYLEQWQNV